MKRLAILLSIAFVATSCATMSEHKTMTGAAVGTVGGAAAGYGVKGKKGAIVGGAAGLLLGTVVGEIFSQADASRQYGNQQYRPAPQYAPPQYQEYSPTPQYNQPRGEYYYYERVPAPPPQYRASPPRYNPY